MGQLRYSDVTPQQFYLNRRRFLLSGSAALGALAIPPLRADTTRLTGFSKSPLSTTEKVTPADIVTGFNNFYEFGTSKFDPARNAARFQTRPWTISIEGEVASGICLESRSL